jgi:hypothetical protein
VHLTHNLRVPETRSFRAKRTEERPPGTSTRSDQILDIFGADNSFCKSGSRIDSVVFIDSVKTWNFGHFHPRLRSFVWALPAGDIVKVISCCSLPDVINFCLPIRGLCQRSVQDMGMEEEEEEEEEEDMLLGLRLCDDTSKDQQIIYTLHDRKEKKIKSIGQAAERAMMSMDAFTALRWCTANLENKAVKPASR